MVTKRRMQMDGVVPKPRSHPLHKLPRPLHRHGCVVRGMVQEHERQLLRLPDGLDGEEERVRAEKVRVAAVLDDGDGERDPVRGVGGGGDGVGRQGGDVVVDDGGGQRVDARDHLAGFRGEEVGADVEHGVGAEEGSEASGWLGEGRLDGEIDAGGRARHEHAVKIGLYARSGSTQVGGEAMPDPGPEIGEIGEDVVAVGFGQEAVVGRYQDCGM